MAIVSPANGFMGGVGAYGAFPNPWLDLSTTSMPKDKQSVLEWCHYIWMQSGPYRAAMERVVSYFITDIEFGAIRTAGEGRLGDDEKEKWQHCFEEILHVPEQIKALDLEKACYGNGFMSLIMPFRRALRCPKCGTQIMLKQIADNSVFGFRYENFEFKATCQKCKTGSGYTGAWEVEDHPDNFDKNLSLKIWPSREIEIVHSIYTGECDYIWRIPADYRQEIKRGNMFELERAPKPVLDAIKKNLDFRFAPGVLYHSKEHTLAGLRTRGWGIPRTLANWREIWHLQVLRRQNEAIALDYIIPMRLISPQARAGAGVSQGTGMDPLINLDAGDFVQHMNSMFDKRRKDPAAWFVSPTPVEYQLLGGEAANLVPKDQLDQAMESLMNSSGSPMEMYRGTLKFQAYPMALRLFENVHQHLPYGHTSFLRWLVEGVAGLLNWEPVVAKMKRVTLADDFEKNMAILQMSMGGAASLTTALSRLGLDFKDETRQKAEEARFQAQEEAAVQEEMSQSAFGEQIAKGGGGGAPGGAAGGGAPMAGTATAGGAPAQGGGQAGAQPQGGAGGMVGAGQSVVGNVSTGPKSMDELMSEAEELSGKLLVLPPSQRNSDLRALKKKHEALHALVKAKLEQQKGQAERAGGQMLLAQQGAGT